MIREQLTTFVPRRYQQRNGYRLLYSWALVADAAIEIALQGMAARHPGFGTETALSRISRDRGIRRGFLESATDFAARVVTWLDDHKKQGNAFELMRQIRGYIGPKTPRIRHVWTNGALGVSVWKTLESDGTVTKEIRALNWDWDGKDVDETYQTRAWLIIYSTPPNDVWTDDETWDDTAFRTWDEDEATVNTWGSTATAEQIQGVRDIIADWKSAATLVPEILICFNDALFDPSDGAPPNPEGLWAKYSKTVGGVAVLARADETVYWIGTG